MISLLYTLLRAKYIVLGTFLVVSTGVLALLAVKPNKYEAHMSFLVRNERADLLVSTDPQQNSIQHGDITEEDINSEVELLGSSELLKSVVEACGLGGTRKRSRGSGWLGSKLGTVGSRNLASPSFSFLIPSTTHFAIS